MSIEYKVPEYKIKVIKNDIDISKITLDDLYRLYELHKIRTLIKRLNDDLELTMEGEEVNE